MKLSTIILVVLSFVRADCSLDTRENEAPRIAGTYVHRSKSNYSIAIDTLIITPYNTDARTFIVTYKTVFSRISHKKLKPKEYQQESAIAVLDAANQQLKEQQHGRIYSFPSSYNELILGTAHYQKIR